MTTSRKSLLLASAFFVSLIGMASPERAASHETGYSHETYVPNFHDVVRDSDGNVVRSSNGECVRTQWIVGSDACAPYVQTVIALEERTVYFQFNKSTLTTKAKVKLDKLAEAINKMGDVKSIRIVGYADRIGSAEYNEKLSKKRAAEVKKYLTKKGVAYPNVTETRWFGDTQPIANCPKSLPKAKKIECLQKDRRVEVEIEIVQDVK